jgi:hypothetical protein
MPYAPHQLGVRRFCVPSKIQNPIKDTIQHLRHHLVMDSMDLHIFLLLTLDTRLL